MGLQGPPEEAEQKGDSNGAVRKNSLSWFQGIREARGGGCGAGLRLKEAAGDAGKIFPALCQVIISLKPPVAGF